MAVLPCVEQVGGLGSVESEPHVLPFEQAELVENNFNPIQTHAEHWLLICYNKDVHSRRFPTLFSSLVVSNIRTDQGHQLMELHYPSAAIAARKQRSAMRDLPGLWVTRKGEKLTINADEPSKLFTLLRHEAEKAAGPELQR